MSAAASLAPALLVGGSGVVGRRAIRALRRLQPELRLVIGARDHARASAVASAAGNTEAVGIDLSRDDLGLPANAAFSAVAVLLKDDSLRALRYAQRAGLPYVAFSDFAFDLAPTVAQHALAPTRSALLLLGHFLGGTVTATTLDYAREFRRLESIAIGGVFDASDVGGPAAAGDASRVLEAPPHPLLRREGRWVWSAAEPDARTFRGADGAEHRGIAYPLLDVASLAAATGARAIRVDLASRVGEPASPSHEVIIELEGEALEGGPARRRYAMLDGDVHAGLSARGVALAVERLLVLKGGSPVPPGLHTPESVFDPAYVTSRLRELGTRIERLEVDARRE